MRSLLHATELSSEATSCPYSLHFLGGCSLWSTLINKSDKNNIIMRHARPTFDFLYKAACNTPSNRWWDIDCTCFILQNLWKMSHYMSERQSGIEPMNKLTIESIKATQNWAWSVLGIALQAIWQNDQKNVKKIIHKAHMGGLILCVKTWKIALSSRGAKKCPNRLTSFLVSAPSPIAVLVSERAERHFGHYAFKDFKSLKERNWLCHVQFPSQTVQNNRQWSLRTWQKHICSKLSHSLVAMLAQSTSNTAT
jgi:hypothetical protein